MLSNRERICYIVLIYVFQPWQHQALLVAAFTVYIREIDICTLFLIKVKV